jgi:hypothetical protein
MYQSCRIFYPATTMVRAAINQFMHPMPVIYIPFPFSPNQGYHSINNLLLQFISIPRRTLDSISYNIMHPTQSVYNHRLWWGGSNFRYL